MSKKPSNKIKKGADKVKNFITKEEYNEDAERYRDKDSKKFTRGPKHDE